MKIGILQTGHLPDEMQEKLGDYSELFHRLLASEGLDLTTYNVVDMQFPQSVHDAEGWLVTGSRHGVYDDLPFIAPLEEFIRSCFSEEVPLVGICFGHQIIAQALGGQVEKFRDGWAVGRQSYAFGGEALALNAWHQDQVIRAPQGAMQVATHPFCENAALLYGKRAFTVQAHPEFDDAALDFLIRVRGPGVVPGDRLAEASRTLKDPVDNAKLARRIGTFFKEAQDG
ncbi:MAG: type 1 glutamine amidotransferase [Rhodobacteraceae bacterium]|nr:type 1 glutamine amidotransferase [Paracoccaceae bacterium]